MRHELKIPVGDTPPVRPGQPATLDTGKARAPSAHSAARWAKESCVLVVDDEWVIRMFVARALESAGYAVLEAGDGAEAMELLEREEVGVDLVLTDIRMPRLSGLELGRSIVLRQWPIPVLYMSADPGSAFGGADAAPCLEKPFSITALLAAVEGLLAQSHTLARERLSGFGEAGVGHDAA